MTQVPAEVWAWAGIAALLLGGGVIGKVWKPMRKTIAAVDALAGRPERYPGDKEARPGLAQRLDNIDTAIDGLRVELETVKAHVQNIETECPS